MVLPSSSPLARSPFGWTSRGSLSRSVFRRTGWFPVPQGTCFCQDVESRIVVSVQHHATACTDVGPHAQRLLDHSSTCATVLAGELRGYCKNRNIVHLAVVLHP